MNEVQTGIPKQKQKKLIPILQGIIILFALPSASLLFINGSIVPGSFMLAAGVLMLVALVGRALCLRK